MKKNRCKLTYVEVLESFKYSSTPKYTPWRQPKFCHYEMNGHKKENNNTFFPQPF